MYVERPGDAKQVVLVHINSVFPKLRVNSFSSGLCDWIKWKRVAVSAPGFQQMSNTTTGVKIVIAEKNNPFIGMGCQRESNESVYVLASLHSAEKEISTEQSMFLASQVVRKGQDKEIMFSL